LRRRRFTTRQKESADDSGRGTAAALADVAAPPAFSDAGELNEAGDVKTLLSSTSSPVGSFTYERRRLFLLPSAGRNPNDAMAKRDAAFRRSLVLADVLAAITATLVTVLVVGKERSSLATLVTVPLIVLLGKIMGIYDRQESLVRKSTLDEAPDLFQVATLYALITWLVNGVLIVSNRREFLVNWLVLTVLLVVYRCIARALTRKVTAPERCLVIGDGPTCERVREKLASRAGLHACVVAHVPIEGLGNERQSLDALSKKGDLRALAAAFRVDRIIIAPELADADEVLNVIRAATSLGVKVSVVPRLLEVIGSSVEFDEVEGIPLLSMRSVRLSRSSWVIKRSLDLFVSLLGLLCLAPMLLIIAAAIKLGSRGPVLFRQRRIGRDGEPFEMLKFRTMIDGAHAQREALRHLNEADGLFKIEDDPRVTKVGRVLRRTSLDELPQLWNVVRGDMSLVGPRPLVVEEDRRIEGWHRRRLQLTPGMTGHWQILGSSRIPLHEMVNIDYLYVTNWSLWNDLKILMRTVQYVAARRGM
jgi:exopolysaccharide biosynthesis polyprenyl glycosylphosphotransferase